MGVLSVMENPPGVLYQREAWARAGGFDLDCPEAPAKLHLGIARTSAVVFIHGGLVSQVCGSAALRISSTRGASRSEGEFAVLRAALGDAACPLSAGDRQAALTCLTRCEKRTEWEKRWGRRLSRMVFPELPPFEVAAKLDGGEAVFDRSLYPGVDGSTLGES
jgi:hypothetical protein